MHDDQIFFPVNEVHIQDLYNWADTEQKQKTTKVEFSGNGFQLCNKRYRRNSHTQTGTKVDCNKHLIALFRYDERVFAVSETCPHAGGPIHLGDVEEMPDRRLCVKCPWHSWMFDLETGKVKVPQHRDLVLKTFPVKLTENGTICIGFDKFADEYFTGNEEF